MAEATLFNLTQRCPRCQQMFGPDGFHPKKWGRTGAYCRRCATDYQRRWNAKNPNYRREYQREYYQKRRPERQLPCHRVWFDLATVKVLNPATGRRGMLRVFQTRPRTKPVVPTKPERLSYQLAHTKIRSMRGSASKHACAECGKQADEWAYDHADPNEVEGLTRRGRVAVYSEDLNHYQPMCRSCHSLHDRAHWFANRLAPVLDSHGIDPEVRDTILKEIKSFR